WWCRAERRYPPRRDAPTGESSPESSPPTSRPPSSSPRTASRGRRWPRTPSAPHGHGTPANNSVQVVSSSRSFQKIEPPNTPGGFREGSSRRRVIFVEGNVGDVVSAHVVAPREGRRRAAQVRVLTSEALVVVRPRRWWGVRDLGRVKVAGDTDPVSTTGAGALTPRGAMPVRERLVE